jgi:hypothetical protein
MTVRIARSFAILVAVAVHLTASADPQNPTASPSTDSSIQDEISRLKQLLSEQQKQLEEQQKQMAGLRTAMELQTRLLDKLGASVAAAPPVSVTPVVLEPGTASAPAPPPQTGEPPTHPYIRIGDAYITPVGFVDFTTVFRTAAAGSGIGTNFGAIPFNNVPTARLTELLPNPQNSRIGMRVDTKVRGVRVIGYWESDFLGNNPGNVAVTSNSDTFRLRLIWVDLSKDKWEILGGQSWSLLTPGRKGISPLPADIFYTQVIDVNYVIGLPWGRVPGFRAVYHPSQTIAAGIALEEPQQYIGGSGGQGSITFPTNDNIATNYANQLDNGTTVFAVPNLHPDVIGKVAFDPKIGSLAQHIEVAGIYRTFKVFNPAINEHFTQPAGGGSLNMNFEVLKGLHLISNLFASSGGGRWLFGSGPDLIVRGDGSLSSINAYSTVSGAEYWGAKWLLYAYYGGVYFNRNTTIDRNGKLVGYGYSGSPNSQNRNIQEATGGFIYTFWKNPNWGALQFMGQYAWFNRVPWFVALGQPRNAHNSTVFVNLRYAFPGNPPNIK